MENLQRVTNCQPIMATFSAELRARRFTAIRVFIYVAKFASRIDEFYNEVDENININYTYSINDIEEEQETDLELLNENANEIMDKIENMNMSEDFNTSKKSPTIRPPLYLPTPHLPRHRRTPPPKVSNGPRGEAASLE